MELNLYYNKKSTEHKTESCRMYSPRCMIEMNFEKRSALDNIIQA
jgi:hypothetical protein